MNKPTTFAAALAIVFATFVMPVTPGAGGLSSAQAAVSVAYSLEQLVDQSEQAVIADVQSHKSHWEDVAGSKRIVTYSKLVITETVFTRTPAKSRQKKTAQTLWVRTLGGNVGKIGQQVSGEATLERGASQLIFLTRSTSGIGLVTGMAQGHYVVDTKRTVTKYGS